MKRKRCLSALLCAALLLTMTACARDDLPAALAPEAECEPDGTDAPVLSPVASLAAERLTAMGAGHLGGEAAVHAIYRHLVETVYFADPVELDIFRHLSGADPGAAISYLENRALSPLLFDIGSCEDFAAATVMLLRAAGFEAHYVAGFTLSVAGDYVDHAWAVVNLDGQWYHLDPQLEQNVIRSGLLTYRYYLKSDDTMLADHRWGENLIDGWPHMPDYEKMAIRTFYNPPACPGDGDRPEPEPIPLPPAPDRADIEAKAADLRRESGLGELAPIALNADPPILVAERHVTPPLTASAPLPPRYARHALRGDAAAFYDTIAEVAATWPDRAAVPVPTSLADREVAEVIGAFIHDHPEQVDLGLDFSPEDWGHAVTLTFGGIDGRAAEARAQRLAGRADAILGPVRSQPDFVKAHYIYDYLATYVNYDQQAAGDSTCAYGPLMGGLATCDGYARAFQYLAHRAGLDCLYIQGQNLRGVPHAWNMVGIDGDYAYADATWARPLNPGDGVYHDYFLMSEEAMLRERRPDPTGYGALPRTSGPDYYTRMGYSVDGTSPTLTEDFAHLFVRQLATINLPQGQHESVFLEVGVRGEASDFEVVKFHFVEHIFAVNDRMQALAAELGLPFDIAADVTLACNFNATTRVITFYPYVQRLGETT